MYYLTTNKNEIEYYKEKSDLLLKKAKPLMEIYRESNIKEYHLFGLIWQSGKRNLLNIRLSFIHIRQDIAQLSPSVCL